MADKQLMPREYGEMIYALVTEMHGSVMAQVRSINNNQVSILKAVSDLQKSIDLMNSGLKETRDKRYQEEIDALELQMANLQKQLTEKRSAKETNGTTSERMQAIAQDVITQREQAELKRKQIDWIDVRNKVLLVIVTAVVLYLIPQIGHLLVQIFVAK